MITFSSDVETLHSFIRMLFVHLYPSLGLDPMLPPWFYNISITLAYGNSAVNPFLYGFGNRSVRRCLSIVIGHLTTRIRTCLGLRAQSSTGGWWSPQTPGPTARHALVHGRHCPFGRHHDAVPTVSANGIRRRGQAPHAETAGDPEIAVAAASAVGSMRATAPEVQQQQQQVDSIVIERDSSSSPMFRERSLTCGGARRGQTRCSCSSSDVTTRLQLYDDRRTVSASGDCRHQGWVI